MYDRKPMGPEIHCRELSLDHPTPEQGSLQKYNVKLPQQKKTVASQVALLRAPL
jgi:hypothetical protein